MIADLNKIVPVLLFLFLAALVPSLPCMTYDMRAFHEPWALYIHRNGLSNACGSGTDYMPVFQYILWVFDGIAGSDENIILYLPFTKVAALIADFAAIGYLCKWIDRKDSYVPVLVLCVCNLGFSYDTLIWGQIDGLLAACMFIAMYYAAKGKSMLSAVFTVLAFNVKVQAIVIVPVWGALMLINFFKQPARGLQAAWQRIISPLLLMLIVQLLLVLPFCLGKFSAHRIVDQVIVSSVGRYPLLCIGAANIWPYFFPDSVLMITYDSIRSSIGFTYKQIGLVLFFASSFLALVPLLILLLRTARGQAVVVPRQVIWLTAALVYLLFYFFNTQMHERYCHPALIFLAAYAFFTRDYWPFIFFSIAYFLTLERTVAILKLPNYDTLIFNNRFLGAINALVIGYSFIRLYKYAGKRTFSLPDTAQKI